MTKPGLSGGVLIGLFGVLIGVLLTVSACAVAAPSTPTGQRLPTRAVSPTATPTITPIPARAYYREGVRRQAAGDAVAAVRSFTWAITVEPDFAPAYVARGQAYLALGDYQAAAADGARALRLDPDCAQAYVLRGEALRRQALYRQALESFARAVELAPDLAPATFPSRWQAALALRDGPTLSALSREYALAHPDDPLRDYYRGWAFIEMGQPDVAISILAKRIAESEHPPALLWFALGMAYQSEQAWTEAVVSLEAARNLVQAGDGSLAVHSSRPVPELFAALGRAYLGAGRCVDAERMLEYAIRSGAPAWRHEDALQAARSCQTLTPTPSPTPPAG